MFALCVHSFFRNKVRKRERGSACAVGVFTHKNTHDAEKHRYTVIVCEQSIITNIKMKKYINEESKLSIEMRKKRHTHSEDDSYWISLVFSSRGAQFIYNLVHQLLKRECMNE